MFAHRRVACTANLGGWSAQFDDATDEIDDDLEERVETSEIIDSGDENVEADFASDDRRADVGNGVCALGFHCCGLSKVDLAKQVVLIWAIA